MSFFVYLFEIFSEVLVFRVLLSCFAALVVIVAVAHLLSSSSLEMSKKKKEDLELEISVMRCTIDTRNKSEQDIFSSEFQFEGGSWKLRYFYHPLCAGEYCLYLRKCSGVSPSPLHVLVQVERCGTGRIVTSLSQVTRFTDEFEIEDSEKYIWWKNEEQILRSFPESRQGAVLQMIVVLKLEGCDSTVLEMKSSTRSISVQTSLLPNTTPCFESLSEDLGRLMVEASDHDVEFKCGGQSTKAHKSIVCSRSPVITSMLTSDMIEGRTGVVTIPDMKPEVFKLFLSYIYCGQLPELTPDLALSLYESGDQYAVLGLAKRCREFLVEHLSDQNAFGVLVVADAHSDEGLADNVVEYMVDRKFPQTSDRWSSFCEEHPKLANKVFQRAWNVFVK